MAKSLGTTVWMREDTDKTHSLRNSPRLKFSSLEKAEHAGQVEHGHRRVTSSNDLIRASSVGTTKHWTFEQSDQHRGVKKVEAQ